MSVLFISRVLLVRASSSRAMMVLALPKAVRQLTAGAVNSGSAYSTAIHLRTFAKPPPAIPSYPQGIANSHYGMRPEMSSSMSKAPLRLVALFVCG